jgi:hypothetical protein
MSSARTSPSPRTVLPALSAFAALCVSSAACSAILDLEPPPGEDAGGDDGSTFDVTTGDAPATDAPAMDSASRGDAGSDAPVCLALDAGGDGSTTYFPLKQSVIDDAGTHTWEFFEPSSVNTLARDFQGGVFDGRYVYFSPLTSGTITRYDTQGSFVAMASWSTFDTSTLGANAQAFNGAVYDGRYVYFVPFHSPGAYDGLIVRYDTATPFTGAAGWSTFDLTTLPVPDGGTALTGFAGGVFDGHAVYFAPYYDGVDRLGRAVRYVPETNESDGGGSGVHDAGDAGLHDGGDAGSRDAGPPPFAVASQFQTFDLTTRNSSAAGYTGALFDGQYVYTIPALNNAGVSGLVARYDTAASFVAGASWTVFDATEINAEAYDFVGAAFDGRFIYLVPHSKAIAMRYDTQAGALASKAAWSSYDLSTLTPADAGTPSFSGAGFDGRFVYFVPGTAGGQGSGGIVRYDTWSTFAAPCAWSFYDISESVAAATSYYGAVFDGQYLYLVPKGTWVARFDTKSPASMPSLPAYNGSFF